MPSKRTMSIKSARIVYSAIKGMLRALYSLFQLFRS